MPHTSVHWSRSSVAFTGRTVVSAVPCQIATRGHGPGWRGSARRTFSAHWAGVSRWSLFWQDEAADRVAAQCAGGPASTAPPANTSG